MPQLGIDEEFIEKAREHAKEPKTNIVKQLGNFFGSIFGFFLGGVLRETIQQEGRKDNPVFQPDANTLARGAFAKGLEDSDILDLRMKQLGYSEATKDYIIEANRNRLELNQLLNLLRRDEISENEFIDQATNLGYPEEQLEDASTLITQRLSTQVVTQSLLRDLTDKLSNEQLRNELKDQGFQDEQIDQIIEVNKFHPSVQDIVRWTGREVFEEQTINDIGLAEEFERVIENIPSDSKFNITEDDKQVVSEHQGDIEAIRADNRASNDLLNMMNEWIAHWEHPSFRQFSEMFHRVDAVDEDTFETWARLVELPPFWREAFKEITHRKITRVDLRRFWKLGVITDEEELKERYEEIGYNDEDAEAMVEFTKQFYKDPEEQEKRDSDRLADQLDGVTRATIEESLREGRIGEEKARQLFKGIGLGEIATEFFINQTLFEKEQDEIDNEIDIIEEEFTTGTIGFNEADTRLDNLGIRSNRKDRLLREWQLDRDKSNSLPSKSDLQDFIKKGIITEEEFRDVMSKKGFSTKHINWYIDLIS